MLINLLNLIKYSQNNGDNRYMYTFSKNDVISSVRKRYYALGYSNQ